MLKAKRIKIHELPREELYRVSSKLCFEKPKAMPITHGVKVFARLHDSGFFTFARHQNDLGSRLISAQEISSRINNPLASSVVRSALQEFEEEFSDNWLFIAGSQSWVQLEISSPEMSQASFNDKPYLIIRKPARISTRPKLVIETTQNIDNLFNIFFCKKKESLKNFELLIAPSRFLEPVTPEIKEIFEKFKIDFSFTREKFSEIISESVMSKNLEAYLKPELGFYIEESGIEFSMSKLEIFPKTENERIIKTSFPLPIGLIK